MVLVLNLKDFFPLVCVIDKVKRENACKNLLILLPFQSDNEIFFIVTL